MPAKASRVFCAARLVAVVSGESVEANQRDGCDGIGAGRGRILKRLAAHIEAAHGRGVAGAIEKSAAFGVAVTGDGEVHGFFRGVEIARFERGFVGIEQSEHAKNLVVERAIERGAADAVSEAARFAPDFMEHAVESFESEAARSFGDDAIEDASGVEISGDEHGVPGNVHGLVDERSGARQARGKHFCFCGGDGGADRGFFEAELRGDVRGVASDPQNIFRGIVMHFALGFDVVVQLHDAGFVGA